LPSSLKLGTGMPRFNLNFPAFYANDPGALHLITNEVGSGYEPPTRDLLERILHKGDLFIDVGAHWGLFSLQAATHPAGEIEVVAFEPEIMNTVILSENMTRNKVTEFVTVIGAACGNQFELAPLMTNSTMGHSINGVGLPSHALRGPSKWVPVVTLDAALARLQKYSDRRIVLKIDAEGYESEIIAGAKQLLRSGRVALIVWEFGPAFVSGAKRLEIFEAIDFLTDCGFRHFQPSASQMDGPLLGLNAASVHIGNVFSFAPQLDYSRAA
jgi:FkbM family methyltransferase